MTAPRIADGLWRPYDDEPLIGPEMLVGLHACDAVSRQRLLGYLDALVERRTAPVHTAVAFNAVYFGYDVYSGGYVGGPMDFDEFTSIALGDRIDALPVGAMVKLRTGGDLLPAEVVYKEGQHPALGDFGETPAWLSGAPAGATGPGTRSATATHVVRERLVFDTRAFGHAAVATRLQRLVRKGRLDALGHLIVDAEYPQEVADASDADYYAHYLVTRERAALTSALAPCPFPALLGPGYTDQQLLTGVRSLMATLREALAALVGARSWGEYVFTRASLARRLSDEGPLSRDDLTALADSTAKAGLPRPGRRTPQTGTENGTATYIAIGPALRGNTEWAQHLHGTDYPLAVCHANAVLSDYARREPEEDSGLLPCGVRFCLDDRWQGGGVWRSFPVSRPADPPVDDPADHPSGRGWAESHPLAAPGPPAPSEDGPKAGNTVGMGFDIHVDDERVVWVKPLRSEELTGHRVAIPRHIAERLAKTAPPGHVRIRHATYMSAALEWSHAVHLVVDADRSWLEEVTWPASFFPGLWLWFEWHAGHETVHIHTRLLDQPLLVDGLRIEHRYDIQVLTRDGGALPSAAPHSPEDGHDLVLTAVRRLGLLDIHASALLPRAEVPAATREVMEDDRIRVDLVINAVHQLLATKRLTSAWGGRDSWGNTHHPPLAHQRRVELVCYRPHLVAAKWRSPEPPREIGTAASVTRHRVAGFIRRIGHLGQEATDEQRDLYREDFRRYRLTGPAELPDGYTYVRPHTRGC